MLDRVLGLGFQIGGRFLYKPSTALGIVYVNMYRYIQTQIYIYMVVFAQTHTNTHSLSIYICICIYIYIFVHACVYWLRLPRHHFVTSAPAAVAPPRFAGRGLLARQSDAKSPLAPESPTWV